MYKSILAATAVTLAASALPAAAYEGEHRHHKPSVGRTMTNSYIKHDTGHRWWWHRRHHSDVAAYQHHHRRHWWSYWD